MNLKKVVIVDDEYLIRELLQEKIDWERMNCELVLKASSASEVLDYIDDQEVDLVITDINMPNIDGMEMAKRIREHSPQIKIVVLTGYNDFEYAKKGIDIGVEGFILKPIDKDEVEPVIEKVIQKIDDEQGRMLAYNEQIQRLENERTTLEEELLKVKTDPTAHVSNKKETSENIIDVINAYIETNMTDSQLTMKGTAEKFFLNPSYLSRIYKKEMGISFKERLFDLRMEKAVELLKKTNMKVYEIGNSVGIEDPNYFSLCFKKYMNMSVSEFKKKLADESK